jgi:AcrR family transcriptional regulator
MSGRPYTPRRRTTSAATRDRIVGAVRELVEEGTFHESTVEEVAARAGVARATLYQHFGSRLGLVDAMCETFDAHPALLHLRAAVDVNEFISDAMAFWADEEKALTQLYGVASVDPAARELVERQSRDRHTELRRLVRSLRAAGTLSVGERRALALLSLATSFETFVELRRRAGLSQRELIATLQESVRVLVLG